MAWTVMAATDGNNYDDENVKMKYKSDNINTSVQKLENELKIVLLDLF